MSGKAWILFDGRAESGDIDAAIVLEFAGTSKRQIKRSLQFWLGFDGVLVEYDADPSGNLSHRHIIGHLREGIDSLLQKCSPDNQKPSQP